MLPITETYNVSIFTFSPAAFNSNFAKEAFEAASTISPEGEVVNLVIVKVPALIVCTPVDLLVNEASDTKSLNTFAKYCVSTTVTSATFHKCIVKFRSEPPIISAKTFTTLVPASNLFGAPDKSKVT